VLGSGLKFYYVTVAMMMMLMRCIIIGVLIDSVNIIEFFVKKVRIESLLKYLSQLLLIQIKNHD